LSIDFVTPLFDPRANELLANVLQEFDKKNGRKTNLINYEWGQIWRELVNVTIYRTGGDLAEIGSSWLESLVSMNGLRPFSSQEICEFGGKEVFFQSLWENLTIGSEPIIRGLPFQADVRVMYYWDDMLETAGVEPKETFISAANLAAGLEKLQQHYDSPLILPTGTDTHNILYNAASWLRGAGGEFLSADNRQTAFCEPQALAGLRAYFGLHKFLPPQNTPITDAEVLDIFTRRKAAVTIAGPWLLNHLKNNVESKELISHLKAALPPGPSFVGGTVLVVWQHARDISAILTLIKTLFEPELQYQLGELDGFLPVQKRFWTEEYMSRNPNLPVLRQAILTGKGLPVVPLWGMIEDRLNGAFGAAWNDIHSAQAPLTPQDLDAILNDRLVSMARRLDITLAE